RQPAEGTPGQEGEVELLADLDLGQTGPELRRVLVLHAHQRITQDRVGRPDLRGVCVGQPHHADLARVGDLLEGADGLLIGHVRVGAVVLPQGDLLDTEPAQALVDGGTQVSRGAVDRPSAVVGAYVPALGREQDTVGYAEV